VLVGDTEGAISDSNSNDRAQSRASDRIERREGAKCQAQIQNSTLEAKYSLTRLTGFLKIQLVPFGNPQAKTKDTFYNLSCFRIPN
jgi:hypothetical protein